ncbi:MAG: hypothetical protein M3258_09100 [Thermoproteota archaeon]|nr:hypothetical protein [Thermoproteota archaeon]
MSNSGGGKPSKKDIREMRKKIIKELENIIRQTAPGSELRTDLEFTRDRLIASLNEEEKE